MSFYHGDFQQRFSEGNREATRNCKEDVEYVSGVQQASPSDRYHAILRTLCFMVTDGDADYLRRLRESQVKGAFSYYNHFYWIMLTVAFRGLREIRQGYYVCEVCRKETTRPEVHHWTYDNCGKEFAHLEDLGLLCTECHEKQPRNMMF